VRFEFIQKHTHEFPVNLMCSVLKVSRSGYYAWRRRWPSPSSKRRAELLLRIRQIRALPYRGNYGAPRMHRELVAQGCSCNRKTVEKLMRSAGLRACTVRKFRVATTDSRHTLPVAQNLVNRDFQPRGKHQTWLADITYVPTCEGWLYLAALEDLHSRKIVGWSMSESLQSALVIDALEMAIAREVPVAGLVAHSDRGSQYASEAYQGVLARHGITCSMSRCGDCWDNAPMESFFATLKKELVHQATVATRDHARQTLFEYIETFYNRVRRHSALDYQSPADFEAISASTTAA
jgi:putative transposase